MTIVSLIASQWMLSYDSSAAYYMMPFRIFELSIGALLVFMLNHRASKTVESCILILGLALIIAAAFVLVPTDPFPGLRALIPCLGAAACIYAGQSRHVGAALRLKPVVYIGLISYSVYLIHWPLIVFYKYYIFRELSLNEKLCLFAIALILGSIMHHSIEKFFITNKPKKQIAGLAITIVATSFTILAGYKIVSSDGYNFRTPEAYRSITADPVNFHTKNYGGYPFGNFAKLGAEKKEPDAYLVGDSFALQYASGLDRYLKPANIEVASLVRQGCYLSTDYTKIEKGVIATPCLDHYQQVLSTIKSDNKPLIYTVAWSVYRKMLGDKSNRFLEFKDDNAYIDLIIKNLSEFREDVGQRELIIVGVQPYTSSSQSAASCLLRPRYISQPCDSSFNFAPEDSPAFEINKRIRAFAESAKNTVYIDPSDSLCPEGICRKFRDGDLMYSDVVHLSRAGSMLVSKQISPVLTNLINGK